MNATTPTAATAHPTSGPSLPGFWRLTRLHTRYQFLETVRIPVAVLGNMMFPALALFFFVVPQKAVAGNPLAATIAIASMALFSACSANMFTHGVGVAEERALPFDPFVRSLPAGPGPRMAGRILTGGAFTLLALVPVLLIGWLFTEASVSGGQLLAGVAVLVLASLPFVLLGLAIGYSLPAKAAIAVVQMLLFPLAFAGGLFLPPTMFPAWLDAVSQGTPTRAGRDLLVQAVTGEAAYAGAWLVLLGWLAAFAVLAVWAYRRDEGRRYR